MAFAPCALVSFHVPETRWYDRVATPKRSVVFPHRGAGKQRPRCKSDLAPRQGINKKNMDGCMDTSCIVKICEKGLLDAKCSNLEKQMAIG